MSTACQPGKKLDLKSGKFWKRKRQAKKQNKTPVSSIQNTTDNGQQHKKNISHVNVQHPSQKQSKPKDNRKEKVS